MKRIAILGSTGSIGSQALDICRRHPEEYRVVALTARGSREKLFEQVREFRPEIAGLTEGIRREEIPEDLEDNREEIIESIIRKEEYRSLYRAIGLLPDAQKEAIMLFYFSSLPVKEIAGIMEKSETNIKVLLCRARERLRKIMEEDSR